MDDRVIIQSMVDAYFNGLHRGDSGLLLKLFHQDCILKTVGARRSLLEWLEDVSSRPIPKDTGHGFTYKMLSLDIEGNQAMVKAECPLPGAHYLDYLGFLKEDSCWKIVTKMYALKPGASPDETHKD